MVHFFRFLQKTIKFMFFLLGHNSLGVTANSLPAIRSPPGFVFPPPSYRLDPTCSDYHCIARWDESTWEQRSLALSWALSCNVPDGGKYIPLVAGRLGGWNTTCGKYPLGKWTCMEHKNNGVLVGRWFPLQNWVMFRFHVTMLVFWAVSPPFLMPWTEMIRFEKVKYLDKNAEKNTGQDPVDVVKVKRTGSFRKKNK